MSFESHGTTVLSGLARYQPQMGAGFQSGI